MKSQLSLEFMLVLAASASLLVALLPTYAQAQQQTREKIIDQAQSFAFKKIIDYAHEAKTLGKGTFLSTTITLRSPQTVFSASESQIQASYQNGLEKRLVEDNFGVEFEENSLEKGEHTVEISNNGSIIVRIL